PWVKFNAQSWVLLNARRQLLDHLGDLAGVAGGQVLKTAHSLYGKNPGVLETEELRKVERMAARQFDIAVCWRARKRAT
ncbi:MAG TPA: hypothetical protein PLW81_14370, partial [Thiobacillaceae bacterium]|nr:hypothetical protein [Thiobacillaceae bacterium]